MTGLYNAIALQTDTTDCKFRVEDAPDYERNLRHLEHMIDMAVLHSMEYPPRLLALCEGAIQGFPDEIHDWESAAYARSGAIDIPGPETDRLAAKAVQWNLYIVGQAKARMPEFPDRFFNTGFVIDPSGEVILQHRKNVVFTIEHTTTPHDLWDQWVAMFGDGLDAFFPVARTPIGNIGCLICMEGNYPEIARGLMMNGAEIIYRPSSIENISTGIWQIQNQARALDNNAYVIAPNTGFHTIDADGTRGFVTGGHPMIVDYRGQILHMIRDQGDAFSAAAINIDGLRQHRAGARHNNWAPHMKGELFRAVYDKMNVWPKNLAADRPPQRREATEEIYSQVIRKLQEDGVQVPPQDRAAETARPKEAPAVPAAPATAAPAPASLMDYILSRTSNLSAGDKEEDEDRNPLAAE